jgi:hypothetical protein
MGWLATDKQQNNFAALAKPRLAFGKLPSAKATGNFAIVWPLYEINLHFD